MSVSATTGTASLDSVYSVRVEKLAQDQQKIEGEAAIQLIEGASPPPVGPQGQGTHVNTFA